MTQHERRRHPRITPKGSVTIALDEAVLLGRIANLSRSGLLVGTCDATPDLLGCTASLEIRLDGQAAEWLRATGRITRVDARSVAIELDMVSAALGQMVDETTSQSHAHRRAITVVLVDGDQQRREAMLEGFRSAGCVVEHAKTPLEAIVHLGESSFEPDLVAIADTANGGAEELRAFVVRNHPRARLMAIGPDFASEAPGLWLSSEGPAADLPLRIRLVLGQSR
ncbi:MAG: PilZ domain-containing protein [Kofleriaceae bacterium]